MTKISNQDAYKSEDPISQNDYIIGTDGDSESLKTKTFTMGNIRSFVNAGLEPSLGGTLAITKLNYAGVLTTPEAVVNQLVPPRTVMPYEIFILSINGNKFIASFQNRTVGDTTPPVNAGDFIDL